MEIVIVKANGTHIVDLIATEINRTNNEGRDKKKTKTGVMKISLYLGLNLPYTLLDVIHHFAFSRAS
jgi:hypothetical protein